VVQTDLQGKGLCGKRSISGVLIIHQLFFLKGVHEVATLSFWLLFIKETAKPS
jgi:hypothetical protein